MFGELMYWIYTGISWILLRWHDLWEWVLPGGAVFLGTTWEWILAIIFLVITIRIILFPIFVKQIRSQRAMQALQPKIKELQEKYKGDKETLRLETTKLFQSEKVNPLMGCLPMFLQAPVFLGLFHVLRRLDPVQSINTTIYGWKQDEWDSAATARLFDAPIPAHFASNASELEILHAGPWTVKIVSGVLVLMMMVTTFLTSRQMILKTGWNQDPQQRRIQQLMLYGIPVSLLLSGWYFPIGVIIYWVTQNLFSLGQQYWVLHKYPPPVTAGNIPMKAPRNAVAGTRRNAFMRFIAPDNSDLLAARNGSRSVDPSQTPSSSGRPLGSWWARVLRRPAAPAVPPGPTPAPAPSRAPKPGMKPVHPKQATATGPKDSLANGQVTPPATGGTADSDAGASSAAPGTPDIEPGVSADGAATGDRHPSTVPSHTAGPAGSPPGAGAESGATPAVVRPGGPSSGGSRSATPRKATTGRKGTARKTTRKGGGARRH